MVLWQCIVERLFTEQVDKWMSSQAKVIPRTCLPLETNCIRYTTGVFLSRSSSGSIASKSMNTSERKNILQNLMFRDVGMACL